MNDECAVMTGYGAVSPLGIGTSALWEGLVQGKSGLDYIQNFDPTYFPIKVAGEVKESLSKDLPNVSRTYKLALTAALEAAEEAEIENVPKESRCGVFLGRSLDWLDEEKLMDSFNRRSSTDEQHKDEAFLNQRFGSGATFIAEFLGITEQTKITRVIDSACATGGMIVGEAFRAIRSQQIDIAIVIGASSWTNIGGLTAYHKLSALTTESKDPTQASCPFDARRSGFVMSEGAGAIVIESLSHARKRGLKPEAKITGYGSTTSAFRITDLPLGGNEQFKAMDMALKEADKKPSEINYINAHGTSTMQNDLVETVAIKKLMKDQCNEVPISANKSMLGHTITAAGVLEVIASAFTIRDQVIPPTINLKVADPECDLNYVPLVARQQAVTTVLSNSFGFGGQNCALVIEKINEMEVNRYDG